MKYAYLYSLDEQQFLEFVSRPSTAQIEQILAALGESDDPTAPWVKDPRTWVTQQLARADWYGSFDVGESQWWQQAITRLISSGEFDLQRPPDANEATLSWSVVDWAGKAAAIRGEQSILGSFKPYRYFNTAERELRLTFWPSHALIASQDLGQLINELRHFDRDIETLEANSPGFKSIFEDEIPPAIKSAAQSIPIIEKIQLANRMLYAEFE